MVCDEHYSSFVERLTARLKVHLKFNLCRLPSQRNGMGDLNDGVILLPRPECYVKNSFLFRFILGPVSRKSRELFGGPHFPLYLRNAEV